MATTLSMRRRNAVAVLIVSMASVVALAVPLPQLVIDKSQASLSDLSSGGYMAVQLHSVVKTSVMDDLKTYCQNYVPIANIAQTSLTATNSCWGWWGYDSANDVKKSGPKMAAVKTMVDQLSGGIGPSSLPPPDGVAVSSATSNSMVITWTSVNGAAGYSVHRNGGKVNALPVTSSTYTDTGLTAGTAIPGPSSLWMQRTAPGNYIVGTCP